MKYTFTLILIFPSPLVNALSFTEIPFNKMIDKAEYIYLAHTLFCEIFENTI